MQHHKKLKGLRLGDLLHVVEEASGDPSMYVNLITVASTGNATFLEELLKAKSDPDIGDAQGRTPLVSPLVANIYSKKERLCFHLHVFDANNISFSFTVYDIMFVFLMHQHIAASKGHEECVMVLLRHGCNIHLRGTHP